jgi:hypothetical protein
LGSPFIDRLMGDTVAAPEAGVHGDRRFHLAAHPRERHHRPGACGTGRNRMVILPFF